MFLTIVSSPIVSTLTAGVCALGCYILTCSTEQFRLLALGQHVSKVLSSKGLFSLMTLALGGVSLYSVNFMNLTGISMTIPEDGSDPAHPAIITFKVVPLSVSLFFACLFAFLGLYVASKDPMFAKTKKQIVDEFIAGAKGMSLKEVKAISAYKMFWVISTKKLGRLTLAGMITGTGAIVTSCLTMWSVALPDAYLVWNGGALFGVGVFACVFSSVSFWILFRLLSLYPRMEVLRIASACFMAFGFILTHYFALDGIQIYLNFGRVADDSVAVTGRHHLNQIDGFYVILVSVIVFCFCLLVLSIIDLRSWLYESSSVVHKHETMLLRLKALHTDNFAIIAKYMREVEFERSHHSRSSQSSSHARHSGVESTARLYRLLPFARGKVAPRSEGDVSTSLTDCGRAGGLPHSLRPRSAVAPMFSIVEGPDLDIEAGCINAAAAAAAAGGGEGSCGESAPPTEGGERSLCGGPCAAAAATTASGISTRFAPAVSVKADVLNAVTVSDSRKISESVRPPCETEGLQAVC